MSKYKLIETKDLSDRMTKLLADRSYSSRWVRTGKNSDELRYTLNTTHTLFGDEIQPSVIISNSTDGSQALRVSVGFFRLVCLNGMVAQDSTFSKRVIHTQGPKVERFLEDFDRIVGDAVAYAESNGLKELETLVAQPLSQPQVINIISKLTNLPKNVRRDVMNRYSLEYFRRPEDESVAYTVWGLWNILNEEIRRSARSTEASEAKHNKHLLSSIRLAAA
jgi:hypothetical protein